MIIDKTMIERDYFNLIKNGKAPLYSGYYIEDNKLYYVECDEMITPTWEQTSRQWIETADLQSQLDYWESELEKVQADISLRKELGLLPKQKVIARKEKCLAKHKEISENIAFSIEKSKKKQEGATDSTV